jgi:nucleotide-binding universal stress UspA family protein
MDDAIARSCPAGTKLHKHLRLGPAADTIVAASRDLAIDHIVMGTNGKTGIERLLVGSVAEQVVRLADVPVTTVRHRPKTV